MKYGNLISPTNSDFWLDVDVYSNFVTHTDSTNTTLVFNMDMIKLSAIRNAISNFVRILTRQNVPVYFYDNDTNVLGKAVYISTSITNKYDFDAAVGLALHDSSHVLFTDYDLVKVIWANIPHSILKLSDSKNIKRAVLEKFIYTIWHFIDDKYVDTYVFNNAPGYRGYYVALYDKYWNSPQVDEYLISDDFRYPSLKSYIFRITNFTNEHTDLLALPCLEDIAKVIDITNIDRLNTTKERINVALKVTEIVLNCLDKEIPSSDNDLIKPTDIFDFSDNDSDDNSSIEPKENNKDVGTKMIHEISDILSGKNMPDNDNDNLDIVDKISNEDLTKSKEKQINTLLDKQQSFLNGNILKQEISPEQKNLLDLIEKHGITISTSKVPIIIANNVKVLKVNCIVVQRMTKELMLAGEDIFPLCRMKKIGNMTPTPSEDMLNAVQTGIELGKQLGRKLQIQSEVNPIKTIRKRDGKINKRLIYSASFDAEDLFYKLHIEKRNNTNLHITIDGSGSMLGEKWLKTIKGVVAISKACSMVNNIHVTISIRTTQTTGNVHIPYIVLAYNSKTDSFKKIQNLFPYLTPNGYTPEGLAFESIMHLFENITPDEEDRYLLNLSDGEPYYVLASKQNGTLQYMNELGVNHTKSQVDKIRNYGVNILSYFISDTKINEELFKNFRIMYGKNAKFITIDSIVDLAKTLNELFLSKKIKSYS